MSEMALKVARMIDLLPVEDQTLAAELVKKLVLAWDPDFTRLTPAEEEALNEAMTDDYIDADAIDWNAEPIEP